jgi:hypothetical protein
MKAGVLLSAALVVAGCSPTPVGNDSAVVNETIGNHGFVSPNLAGGTWNGVFGDPKVSIDHFSRIGLRPGPYEKKGGEWRSEAVPTAMSDPSGPHPVMAYFTATGDERTLNKIEFALVEPQMSNDQQARDQFDTWLKQALTQLGVSGGDTAVGAIHGEKRLSGKLKTGADYAVARPTTAKERRLVVTFTRAAPILNGTDAATS